MKELLRISFLSLFILIMPTVVFGTSVSGAWGGPGYSDFNAEFGFGNGFIWHTGDYFQQIVTGTGLASVNSLTLNLFFDNQLDPGFSQTFAVLLNSISVGSFTVAAAQISFSSVFNFLPVSGASGTNYTIRLQQTSADIPDGNGSIALLIGGESTYRLDSRVTAVPEPTTLTLIAVGLGIGELARRRRR